MKENRGQIMKSKGAKKIEKSSYHTKEVLEGKNVRSSKIIIFHLCRYARVITCGIMYFKTHFIN